MKWEVPWHPVAHDASLVVGLEQELRRELGVGHPLHCLPARALGRRPDCDDVLFALEDGTGRVAAVHLTFTHSPPERPPWPLTTIYASFEAWVSECMHRDHEEFQAAQ
jgi:hypothetical protein